MTKKHDKKCPLVPRLRFPEFQDAGEWENSAVGRLLTESCEMGSKGDTAKKLTVKLWGRGVFGKDEIIKGSASTQYYRRRAGQFIYSKLDFLNQAFGIIPSHLDGFESTVDLPCFDLCSDISPIFLLEYVKREDFYKKYGEIADGGRKAKRIQVDTFLSFPILLPPQIKEQQKIADCLSSLDERIDAEISKLDRLKDHKKGLLKQLFPAEGKTLPALRFSEFRDAGEWEATTIGNICKSYSGGTPDTKCKDYYSGDIPFIRSAEIGKSYTEVFLSPLGLKNSPAKIAKMGSILVALYGANSGDVAINNIDGAINQAILCLESEHDHYFILNHMLSTQYRIISKYIQGGQGNISAEIVKSIRICLPAKLEQQKIADCFFSLDELIAAQTQKVDLLKSHKKGLMQQLFPEIDEVLA